MIDQKFINEYVVCANKTFEMEEKLGERILEVVNIIYSYFKISEAIDICPLMSYSTMIEDNLISYTDPTVRHDYENDDKDIYDILPEQYCEQFPLDFLFFNKDEIYRCIDNELVSEKEEHEKFKDLVFSAKSKLTPDELEALKQVL